MGTYSDEDPNDGVGQRIVNSVKKIIGIPADPTKADTKNASSNDETAQETADRISNQSTNAANGYGN
jgi:hypothetical protein